MQKILKGYHHFHDVIFPQQRETFQQLAREQRPRALFITCSDSRVHPNLITQTEPGELFILRNPGNLVPPYHPAGTSEAATIEYSIAILNVEHIIVCGHSNCGAVGALLKKDEFAELPAITSWLHHAEVTRRVILDRHREDPPERQVARAIEWNVLCQLDNLRTHPAILSALTAGRVKLYGWVYDIASGDIVEYDPAERAFLSLRHKTEMTSV